MLSSGQDDLAITHLSSQQLESPEQDQANQNSSMGVGEMASEASALPRELLAVNGCQRRDSHLSVGM